MSDSPVKRLYSTRSISPISFLSLNSRKIQPDKSPHRRASSPSLPAHSRRDVVIHQAESRDPEPRNSNPQLLLTNRWIDMKLELQHVYLSILYANMLAGLFTWLLLAGFIVLPVTFASLRNSRALNSIGSAGRIAFNAVQNGHYLALAVVCFTIGVGGLSWIWWDNRKNYIWLTERVFM
jgi:hypothetical protein